MNLGPFSVGQPWVLHGLWVCPLLVVLTFWSRVRLSRALLALTTLTRVLAAALAVLAVADARILWPSRKLAVAVVIDDSASVSPAERAAVEARLRRLRSARGDVAWEVVHTAGGPDRTDLESGLALALANLPADRARRVVVATDGRENRGDVLAAADRARREAVPVSVLAMGDAPAVDAVAVTGIDTPRLVRAARPTTVGVRIYSATARDVPVVLQRDGVEVARAVVHAPAGPSIHDMNLEFPDEGVHALRAAAAPDGDPIGTNNEWTSLVRVVTPPRVLLVHESDAGLPALATVFRDARLRVDAVRVGGMPDGAEGLEPYQLAVFDELTLTSLSETQQHAIREWVETRGGGLITVTGSHAVRRDPEVVREIEPVRPPRAIPEPRPLELILVIDRSGSMQGAAMTNARNGAIAAVRALRVDARVGAVAFSGEADAILPPVPMNQSSDVVTFLSGIRAGGGTDIGAALQAASGIVSRDPRYLHHVILLSDGESDAAPALAAAQTIVGAGATISAITLGPRNDLMAEIARIGRGRYHVTMNAGSLPALLVREAQYHLPPPSRDVRFRPRVVRPMAYLDGVDFAADPPLGGFVLADLRPGADMVLATSEGGPLLAHWYRGLGQVATFTSASTGRWSNEWRTGTGFRRLFTQMAWEMLRVQADEALELHVDTDRRRPGIRRVSAVSAGVAMTPLPLVMLTRPGGAPASLAMYPRGPGVWQVDVPVEQGFVVDARLPSSPEPTVAAGADAPASEELASFGSDGSALAALAAAGGGQVLPNLDAAVSNVRPFRVAREVRLPLLIAALALYLLGVLLLRLPGRASRAVAARDAVRTRPATGAPASAPPPSPPANDVDAAA